MNISPATRKELVRFLRFVHDSTPEAEVYTRRDAGRLARLLEVRAPKKNLPGPTRREAREAKRKKHRADTAVLRMSVFTRANGVCEFCRVYDASEMHHLEGGSDRRAKQASSNCVALCLRCHRDYHRSPARLAEEVRRWSSLHGYPLPRRFR